MMMKDSEYGRYYNENMKNKLSAENNCYQNARYSSLPGNSTAPKIELTINQNYEPPPSTSRNSNDISQFMTKPNLPPNMTHLSTTAAKSKYKHTNKGLLYVALSQLLISVVILSGGAWCHNSASQYCPYRTSLWSPVIFLITAFIGISTAKLSLKHFYFVHLVLLLIAIITAITGTVIAYRNWTRMGSVSFSLESNAKDFCVLDRYDSGRLNYITKLYRYDFDGCLKQFKIGLAVNSSYLILSGIISKFQGFYFLDEPSNISELNLFHF
uniref:Transmembrane protein n=1 Tax=Syphacia muris TaxID=451379 RepID=A0A0N5ATA0_9BILA